MINGSLTEFMDKLYYGGELLFDYHGKIYFVQGWIKDGLSNMVLDEQTNDSFEGYLWECIRPSMMECAEEFLNAPIWDGKSFTEIEREVTWME